MKQLNLLAIAAVLFLAFAANAEVKNLDNILAKLPAPDKSNFEKVKQQIKLEPAKDPAGGKSVYKVVSVEKGSFLEKEGLKAGDLVAGGGWESSGINPLNKAKPAETKPKNP